MIRHCYGVSEYPALVDIWRGAVRATHDFLQEVDFQRIEGLLTSSYFPAVTLIVAERRERPVGFVGILDGGLEMLFVRDGHRGQGVGSALLAEAVKHHGVTKVEVNEQNPGARAFYVSKGFKQVSRSETDAEGRPYPILHLELPS